MREINDGKSVYWICDKCGNIVRPKKNKRRTREEKTILPKEQLLVAIKKSIKDEYGVDVPETIEWEDEVDPSLSLEENLTKIAEKLKAVIPEMQKTVDKDYVEYLERKQTEEEEQYYRQEFEKRIEQIKNNEIVELREYFRDYYEHIEAFVNNKVVNGFVVVGDGGIGKTFNLMLKLKEMNIDFVMLKGHITALSFYRKLYENRENSYIIIDDIAKLKNDKDIISLLLGALDYNNKIVSWNSTAPLTSDLPREFIFNSKVFVLANEFDENDEFVKALKDRCIYFELKFSKEQIIEMLYILAKKKGYPIELVDYIKELSDANVIKNLSLRLLDKLYPYYNKPEWKKLIRQIVEIDEIATVVLELMKSGKTVNEQIKEFERLTGMSRATFFRIKARLKSQSLNV